jgi:OOP family OmpA-OmpF porin
MIKSGSIAIRRIAFPIALTLVTLGCATKKYVKQQVTPLHQQVATVEKQTNDKIAYLNGKQERDISAVNERISTTDERVTQVAQATQQAQGTASRAMDEAKENSAKIEENSAKTEENSTAITNLKTGVTNALNYQLLDRADVMFGFNKSKITATGKRTLDELIEKAKTVPRTVIEVAAFTDPVGSKSYNLTLSRRRAEAVQRYLVERNVPVRSIHLVGLGEEAATPDFQPQNPPPSNSRADRYQMARRAQVRLFGAGDLNQGSDGRQQQ